VQIYLDLIMAQASNKKSSEKSKTPETISTIGDCFRRWGYLNADIDPLDRLAKFEHPEITKVRMPIAEKRKLIEAYCSKIGIEYMHIAHYERCEWIASRMESKKEPIDSEFVLKRLVSAEKLENFIHTKYIGSKWFSLEGLTSMIPLIDSILERAAENGVETVIAGMAHRGRLSTIHHISGVPISAIFSGFEDIDPESFIGGGDAKYHKGSTGIYKTRTGKEIKIHFASNPSHLESVNPVVMGRVKAKLDRMGDKDGQKVLALIIHGDAAFAGQGLNAESLNFAELRGFNIGGTIHIVANNLVGFTAEPSALFSGFFATDVAKRLPIPILHVNADSPDDVCRVGYFASDYRSEFKSDVIIDLVGYRRFGHNEVDDPTPTSPLVYNKIQGRPFVHQLYAKEKGVSDKIVKQLEEDVLNSLRAEFEVGKSMTSQPKFYKLPDYWDGFVGGPYSMEYEVPTAVSQEKLAELTTKITTLPAKFNSHPKYAKGLESRKEMFEGKKPIDWGMAEALAFSSLLEQGVPIRIAGQDSRRATFNHRQSVFYDIKNGAEYVPLNNLAKNQGAYQAFDSQLSEAAAMGFEYGYSRDYPETLVCWEAQFGDFVNGAQIIIDQYLSAAEDKWGLLSGLTLLLPHAFEGQGPEHSSARPERFLQLCGEDNMQVIYPSTSAQYFHLLRRQALRKWRKPLIVLTPKGILRSPSACCTVGDLTSGGFQNCIDDSDIFTGATQLILCTGKIVHELRAERKKQDRNDIAIVTIEQLYPFPERDLIRILDKYSGASTITWVQEEPANMGALFFVLPRIERLAAGRKVNTVRRAESASPATGSAKAHAMEQNALLSFALTSE